MSNQHKEGRGHDRTDFSNVSAFFTASPNKRPARFKKTNCVLNEQIRAAIRGAVAEIDPQQIAASKQLTPTDRVWQAASMIEAAEDVSAFRLRMQHPHLTEDEAYRIVRSGTMMKYEDEQRRRKS